MIAALLYAVAVSVLSATALAFARGSLDALAAWTSLLAGAAFGAWSLWRDRRRIPSSAPAPPSPWEWAAILLYTLVSARAFLWLVFTDGDHLRVLSPNNLGDLSLHLTYIHYLASGAPFWPDNPIFTGGKLTYPVGVDLFNAQLTVAGLDVQRGLLWVGCAGAALTGFALWRWGRAIALLALLGNGGLAALVVVQTRELADFQSTLAWKNFFLALLVTQRGLLFALPAGLLLLASWRARFFGGNPNPAPKRDRDHLPLWGELLLYASLPIFHLHTFLFLSLLLGTWFLLLPALRPPLARLVGLAFLPATALVLLVTGGLHGSSILGWKPGWMWDDASWITWCTDFLPGNPALTAPLLFWPVNFGFTLPLIAWLGWKLWREEKVPINHQRSTLNFPRACFPPALGIFLLCVFVKFAPWEWDNTKIMIWSWLCLIPLAWQRLIAPRPLWQRALAILLLFGSGVASLLGGLRGTGYDIASRYTRDGIAKAVAPLPIGARFAGYPTYNHPLLLCGRKMALGYPGHAWSHGLDYQPLAARIETLMNGEPDWQAAAVELRVRYLLWADNEREHYGNSPQPWKKLAPPIATGDWGQLYDLQSPAR